MDQVLRISALHKDFGSTKAINGLDLEIERGTVHGLVGPNGAGKTTMLSILVGLRQETSGAIEFGVPSNKIMLLPDTPEFFPFLTTRETVDLARSATADDVSADMIDQVISEVGLHDAIDRKVGGFSRGMKQRLGLATTVIAQPDLLLLDEPCSALDPLGRREVLNLVKTLGTKSTVLLSTHLLSDVESICDTVTVMNNGRSLYRGSVKDLHREAGESFEDAVLRMLDSDGGALYE